MAIRSQFKKISIIGAGSWGTSIALTIAETYPDITVCMWAYEKNVVSSINNRHENLQFLPNVVLPTNIRATGSIREAVSDSDVILISTPSKVIPDITQRIHKHLNPKSHVGFLTKGFCKYQDEVLTISQTIGKIIPELKDRVVAVYGPSHAEEVSLHYHTCLNVAGKNVTSRKIFIHFLSSHSIQCRETDDIIGVEMGGTLKNPAAIAAGMISVLPNCGDNLSGALISEALKEMLKIGRLFNVRDETIIDISGLGDLVATALSDHSRNRRFGKDIGLQIIEKGNALRFFDRVLLRFKPQFVLEKMSENLHYLAEGAYAIEPLIELAEANGISIPVYRSLYEVLLNKKDPSLLIETIKNPDKFEEIYRRTKIQISDKKKGLENVGGRAFRSIIEGRVLSSFIAADGSSSDTPIPLESVIENFNELRNQTSLYGSSVEENKRLNAITDKNYEKPLTRLINHYVDDVADLYSVFFNRTAMILLSFLRVINRLSGNGGILDVYGDVDQIRNLSDMGNPLYVCSYTSVSDLFLLIFSIKKARLPFPRFMVSGDKVKTSLEKMAIKLMGGFIIDTSKINNVVYREVVKQYLSTLTENGVPFLYFPESVQNGMGADSFYSMISDIIFRHTVEIILIPMELSYAHSMDESILSLLALRTHMSRSAMINFSEPAFLSEFTRETESLTTLGEKVQKIWKRDKKIFPHVMIAKILQDNTYEIELKQLESASYKYFRILQVSPPSKMKKFINAGVSFLKKEKTVMKENGMLKVLKRMEIDNYAALLLK